MNKTLKTINTSNIPNSEEGCHSSVFSYMDYRKVTDKSTINYKILNDESAYTDEITGIRVSNDRYCVAVGSGIASPGDKIDVYMQNGNTIHCIVGDAKSDAHTDEATHTYHVGGYENDIFYPGDGSVMELIVDKDYFNGTLPEEMSGQILNIEVVE